MRAFPDSWITSSPLRNKIHAFCGNAPHTSQGSRPEPATGEQDEEVALVQSDVHDLIVREPGCVSRPRQAVITGPPHAVTRQRDDDGAVGRHSPHARLTDCGLPPCAAWLADGEGGADREE